MQLCVNAFVLLALCAPLIACSKQDLGSTCTDGPTRVVEERRIALRPIVDDAVVFQKAGATVITIGRKDALALLDERRSIVPTAVSSVEDLIASVPEGSSPLSISELYPKLDGLSGVPLKEGILVSHELQVLLLHSLEQGKAKLELRDAVQHSVIAQGYLGSSPDGAVKGRRYIAAGERIHDHCYTTPQ